MYEYLMNAPHILIGGTTGSGKSVLLNGIICELMESSTASKTRLYLIDPKRVELYPYSKTEYCAGYSEEAEEVPALLDTLIDTINERFVEMRNEGLKEYGGTRIYVVIDELADLMISDNAKEIRTKLQKILQIGRAAGVHIIAATQAPNREVIPASLVLNFTDRIALRCLSSIESRQLINFAGAEKITGFGTALYLSSKGLDTIEIPYVSSEDIKKVCDKYAVKTIEWGSDKSENSIAAYRKKVLNKTLLPAIFIAYFIIGLSLMFTGHYVLWLFTLPLFFKAIRFVTANYYDDPYAGTYYQSGAEYQSVIPGTEVKETEE